jgi:Ca2+-binding EF-hand superfamily protein
MAVSEAVKKQFIDFITLQIYDDQYIDREEEKQIIEEGIKKGISVEESLAIMRQLSQERGWVHERDAEERAKEMLEISTADDGKIDKKEFEQAVEAFRKHSKGKIPEPEMKRRLKKIVEDNGWKAKEGGLFGSKWFSAIE